MNYNGCYKGERMLNGYKAKVLRSGMLTQIEILLINSGLMLTKKAIAVRSMDFNGGIVVPNTLTAKLTTQGKASIKSQCYLVI